VNVLLTNDDGIENVGILMFAEQLASMCNLWVCAPYEQQSSTSHAISGGRQLKVREHSINGVKQAWSVEGKPADCVKIAMSTLVEAPIDLVISGINDMSNYGTDIFYSGTVAAAVEGAMRELPAFAFSIVYRKELHDRFQWETACKVACDLVGRHICGSLPIPSTSVLNVNIPSLPFDELKGYKLVRLGAQGNASFPLYERAEAQDEGGDGNADDDGVYYRSVGGRDRVFKDKDPEQDIVVVFDGYVSLTPLLFDRTDYKQMEELKRFF